MNLRILSITLVVLIGLAALAALDASPPEPVPEGDAVLLLELFTSQGCSSCPPADRVLSKLAEDPGLRDRIIPLSFHVDYWNHIGWTDPFSDSSYSERQRDYGRAFRLRSVYTPQLVIHGQRQMVGSREREIRAALHDMLTLSPRITLSITPRDSSALVTWQNRSSEHDSLDLYLVIYENGLVTQVARGENRGRMIRNDGVVRVLHRIERVSLRENPRGSQTVPVRVDPEWNSEQLGIAVFLQDPATMEIAAAANARFP